MKIFVTGNSHSACLIEAWKQVQESSPHQIDFFVRGGSGVKDYRIDGTRIEAGNDDFRGYLARLGLRDSFDLAEYDARVVIGAEISPFLMIAILNKCHVLGWPDPNRRGAQEITERCLQAALADGLRGANGGQMVAALQALPGLGARPMLVVPQPFPSERLRTMGTAGAGFLRAIRGHIAPLAAAGFADVASRTFADLGAHFLPQPEDTTVDFILTPEAFTSRAKRLIDLDKVQPKGDFLHANAAFGARILDQILGALDA